MPNDAHDKRDWHTDGALDAGQPEAHGFAHIGLFLAWLIRHDLHDPDAIRPDWTDAVKAGEMVGSDLADAIDGTLTTDLMSREGAEFSDAYYQHYLDDFASSFASMPAYGVGDDAEGYAVIAPVIDSRYRQWASVGRPSRWSPSALPDNDGPTAVPPFGVADGLSSEPTVTGEPPGGTRDRIEELEARIPMDATEPPMEVSTATAAQWGEALLLRALKRLAVKPSEATVTDGMGGHGVETVTVTLYSVPAASAGDLDREFKTALHLPPKSAWQDREINGRDVRWAIGPEFGVAFWAEDGLVIHASAIHADGLEALVRRLL